MPSWRDNCKTDLTGTIALVTGASSGIGLETTAALAKLGAKVIMACRNVEKAEQIKKDIIEKSDVSISDDLLVVKCLELKSKQSIKQFSDDIHQSVDKIHLLINNAGLINNERCLSDDGFEMTFAVNHLGHFYLTFLLMDILQNSGDDVRVINVSSEAYKMGTIICDDLNLEKRNYSAFRAYSHSKLANVLFTKQLVANYAENANIRFYVLHPGAVHTDINRDFKFIRSLVTTFKFMLKSAERGSYTTLYCALSKDPLTNGAYFQSCKEVRLKARGLDMAVAKNLWEASCEMLEIDWMNSKTQ